MLRGPAMNPVFRWLDEVLATGYLVFRGALEMSGYAATAFAWLAMARLASVPAQRSAPGVIDALARLPDAAITPYVDIVFSLGALRTPKGHIRQRGSRYEIAVPADRDPITKRYRRAARRVPAAVRQAS